MASHQSREREADATRLVTELFPVTETEAEDLPEPGPAINPFELPPPQTACASSGPSVQDDKPARCACARSSILESLLRRPLQAADVPLRGFSAPPRVPEMRLRADFCQTIRRRRHATAFTRCARMSAGSPWLWFLSGPSPA